MVVKFNLRMLMKNAFLPGVLFIVGGFLFTIIRLQAQGYKYDKYLRRNHFEKWQEVTTVFGFSPGLLNSYRAWKFLFSNECYGDEELLIMKSKVRRAMYYVVIGGFASLFAMLMMAIMMQEG
jgi:hypothetical protein